MPVIVLETVTGILSRITCYRQQLIIYICSPKYPYLVLWLTI